jgi:hypothetical protein
MDTCETVILLRLFTGQKGVLNDPLCQVNSRSKITVSQVSMQSKMTSRYLILQLVLNLLVLPPFLQAQTVSTEQTNGSTDVMPSSVSSSMDSEAVGTMVVVSTNEAPVQTVTSTPEDFTELSTVTVNNNDVPSNDSSSGNDTSKISNSTAVPTNPSLCLQCVGCTETNATCLSPAGICYMSFSTLTNLTSRGCQVNETVCEIAYPEGISANGVCQYCCSGELCNDKKLTLSQCLEIIGDKAEGLRMSAFTVVGTTAISMAAYFGRL